jgi:hypothetical protein
LAEYAGPTKPVILPGMKRKKRKKNHPPPEGYVLLPGVTHPQGRPQAFADAMKAMVRGFIEVNNNPGLPPKT